MSPMMMNHAMPVSLTPTLSRYPLLNPLGETTSHSTRLHTTAAKSLVIPQAGEEANEKSNLQSLRARGRTNRYASFTLQNSFQPFTLQEIEQLQ